MKMPGELLWDRWQLLNNMIQAMACAAKMSISQRGQCRPRETAPRSVTSAILARHSCCANLGYQAQAVVALGRWREKPAPINAPMLSCEAAV